MSPARERGWVSEVLGGEASPGGELGGLVVRGARPDRVSISTDLARLLNLGQVWRTCNSATTNVVSARELSAQRLDELQAMGTCPGSEMSGCVVGVVGDGVPEVCNLGSRGSS